MNDKYNLKFFIVALGKVVAFLSIHNTLGRRKYKNSTTINGKEVKLFPVTYGRGQSIFERIILSFPSETEPNNECHVIKNFNTEKEASDFMTKVIMSLECWAGTTAKNIGDDIWIV